MGEKSSIIPRRQGQIVSGEAPKLDMLDSTGYELGVALKFTGRHFASIQQEREANESCCSIQSYRAKEWVFVLADREKFRAVRRKPELVYGGNKGDLRVELHPRGSLLDRPRCLWSQCSTHKFLHTHLPPTISPVARDHPLLAFPPYSAYVRMYRNAHYVLIMLHKEALHVTFRGGAPLLVQPYGTAHFRSWSTSNCSSHPLPCIHGHI